MAKARKRILMRATTKALSLEARNTEEANSDGLMARYMKDLSRTEKCTDKENYTWTTTAKLLLKALS